MNVELQIWRNKVLKTCMKVLGRGNHRLSGPRLIEQKLCEAKPAFRKVVFEVDRLKLFGIKANTTQAIIERFSIEDCVTLNFNEGSDRPTIGEIHPRQCGIRRPVAASRWQAKLRKNREVR